MILPKFAPNSKRETTLVPGLCISIVKPIAWSLWVSGFAEGPETVEMIYDQSGINPAEIEVNTRVLNKVGTEPVSFKNYSLMN